jgi:hypothetical protein
VTDHVTEPGRYLDVPAERYHAADWTPMPALSSSGAKLLDQECPALYWHQFLNPDYVPPQKDHFDIGSATHLLVLEPHLFEQRVALVDHDDWRTNAAKAARTAARAAGRVPLKRPHFELVQRMRDAIMAHPVARIAFEAETEVSYAWIDQETRIWCKARPDCSPIAAEYCIEVKTSTSANPMEFEAQASRLGYFQRAAWQLEAKRVLDGVRPQRFYHLVVSTEEPHLVSMCPADPESLAWGAIQNKRARRIFAECMASGDWYGYGGPENLAVEITLAGWRVRELERRKDRGDFVPSDFDTALGADAVIGEALTHKRKVALQEA